MHFHVIVYYYNCIKFNLRLVFSFWFSFLLLNIKMAINFRNHFILIVVFFTHTRIYTNSVNKSARIQCHSNILRIWFWISTLLSNIYVCTFCCCFIFVFCIFHPKNSFTNFHNKYNRRKIGTRTHTHTQTL